MNIFDRLWNALRPDRLSCEVQAEMETHLALLEEEERARGLSRDEARTRARRRFGNRTAYWEQARDADLVAWLDTFRQDVRLAFRQALRRPGFSATCVSLLALGIGVNAAI